MEKELSKEEKQAAAIEQQEQQQEEKAKVQAKLAQRISNLPQFIQDDLGADFTNWGKLVPAHIVSIAEAASGKKK